MLSMEKRAEMFEAKLSQYDLVTLSYICKRDVQNEVDKAVDKKTFAINQALETCIAAALFDSGESTIAKVEAVIKRINEYMKENEDFLIEYKEDWIMKINEIKPQIKEECLKILDKGTVAHNDALNELKKVFPKVPNKDLINIFQETKEEYQENDEAIKEIADEIANKITTQKQPISEEKEVSNAIAPEKENKSLEKQIDKQKERLIWLNNKFKPTKFQGTWHNYEKVDEGLKIGVQVFKDVKEYEELKNEKIEELKKQIDAINSEAEEVEAAFEYLHMR